MIVADSDVLIDALRGRQPGADRIALELRAGALATTAITVFELLSGARAKSVKDPVERLLAALIVLPFDEAAARAAAGRRGPRGLAGHTLTRLRAQASPGSGPVRARNGHGFE